MTLVNLNNILYKLPYIWTLGHNIWGRYRAHFSNYFLLEFLENKISNDNLKCSWCNYGFVFFRNIKLQVSFLPTEQVNNFILEVRSLCSFSFGTKWSERFFFLPWKLGVHLTPPPRLRVWSPIARFILMLEKKSRLHLIMLRVFFSFTFSSEKRVYRILLSISNPIFQKL